MDYLDKPVSFAPGNTHGVHPKEMTNPFCHIKPGTVDIWLRNMAAHLVNAALLQSLLGTSVGIIGSASSACTLANFYSLVVLLLTSNRLDLGTGDFADSLG